jgi:hypothetical protein
MFGSEIARCAAREEQGRTRKRALVEERSVRAFALLRSERG